jgi:hypothetical protein
MQAVRNLLDLLFGRVTGVNTMEFAGQRYMVAPVIAGADGAEDGEEETEETDKGSEENPEDKGKGGSEENPEAGSEEEGDEKLGEAGKAALKAEREARRKAERELKAAQKKISDAEEAELGEKEKAERRAEKAEEASAKASAKLQRANLLTALADEHKLTGAKAKAAARLLEGSVEFDDDDEPTNLRDAVKAAKAEYGEESFKAAATATSTDDADQGARPAGGDEKPKGLKGAIAASLKSDK